MGIQKPGFLRKDALGPAHGRKKPGFEESECDRELSLLFGDLIPSTQTFVPF